MVESEKIQSLYFRWLCKKVSSDYHKNYKKLLHRLHEIDFYYLMEMDGNREADGIDLRYAFAEEKGYSASVVAHYVDYKPCSVLEVLVALSIRCEVHIMDNPIYGDRTSVWFWSMIDSLGLGYMDDDNYDGYIASKAIHKFLERDYEPSGKGGLFTVKSRLVDMRNVELWYQLSLYLDELEEDEDEGDN